MPVAQILNFEKNDSLPKTTGSARSDIDQKGGSENKKN